MSQRPMPTLGDLQNSLATLTRAAAARCSSPVGPCRFNPWKSCQLQACMRLCSR